jgi:hypothetical protein
MFPAGIRLTPALSMNRNGHEKAQESGRATGTNPEGRPVFIVIGDIIQFWRREPQGRNTRSLYIKDHQQGENPAWRRYFSTKFWNGGGSGIREAAIVTS